MKELDGKNNVFDIKLWIKAINLCIKHANGKVGITGEIKCPKCGNVLKYSVAAYNGHVWGECCTDGCISWIQ